MKTIRRMARHLVKVFRAASRAVRRLGREWYSGARETALHMFSVTGRSLPVVCGVIAALSPRLMWKRNIAVAWDVLQGNREPRGVFRGSLAKALRIMDGETPDAVLRGPKVRAFYAALMGDTDAAVVDVWTARAAGLKGDSLSARQYAEVEQALRLASKTTRQRVSHLQAIAWVQVRGRAA